MLKRRPSKHFVLVESGEQHDDTNNIMNTINNNNNNTSSSYAISRGNAGESVEIPTTTTMDTSLYNGGHTLLPGYTAIK